MKLLQMVKAEVPSTLV